LITSEEHTFLSSTTVREIAALHGDISTMVPPHVEKALLIQMDKIGDQNRMNQYTSLRD
jgi:pantetheine-phosphate adenylyltransferase